MEEWIDNADEAIDEAFDKLETGFGRWVPVELMNKLQLWRKVTTSLIGGDRFDVKSLKAKWIDDVQHSQLSSNIDHFCSNNRDHPLSMVRMSAQREVMQQLENDPSHLFYTLDMPTGYGKTVTALKMATWLGKKQGYKNSLCSALSIYSRTDQSSNTGCNEGKSTRTSFISNIRYRG